MADSVDRVIEPNGPLPPEVYWRRRILAGVLALGVVAVIIGLIVWTTTENDPTAALVAAQFKQKAQVVVVDEAYGPGVDVLLGAKFTGVLRKGPKEQPLAEVKKTCID